MPQLTIKVADVLDAPPEAVYATIADYQQGHPNILPPKHLFDLRVEAGGYGAGTVIRFKSRVLGVERAFHHRVTEPVPGSVLVEQDIDDDKPEVTTFTVISEAQGAQSHVEISTTFTLSPGINGVIERMVIPWALRPIYRQELALLEHVAGQRMRNRAGAPLTTM